eukprot:797444-Rhodomonas_salina.3
MSAPHGACGKVSGAKVAPGIRDGVQGDPRLQEREFLGLGGTIAPDTGNSKKSYTFQLQSDHNCNVRSKEQFARYKVRN